MNKTEFLEYLKHNLTSLIPQDNRKEVENYLSGDSKIPENLPIIQKNIIYYSLINTILDNFHSDYGDIAKRAYNVISQINSTYLINRNVYYNNVYQMYLEADLSEKFVMQDIFHFINNSIESYAGQFCSTVSQAFTAFSAKQANYSKLAEAYSCYETLIEQNIPITDPQETNHIEKMVLSATCVKYFNTNPEKKEYYLCQTIDNLFSLVKTLYKEQDLATFKEDCLFSDEFILYYEKANCLSKKRTSFETVALVLSCLLADESPMIHDILRLILRKSKPNTARKQLLLEAEELDSLYQKLNLPPVLRIQLYAENFYMEDFHIAGEAASKQLTLYYHEYKEAFLSLYESYKNEKQLAAAPLLSIRIKEDPLFSEKEKCDEVSFIEQTMNSITNIKNSPIILQYKGREMDNLNILSEEDYDFDCAQLLYERRYANTQSLLKTVAVLNDVSILSRQLTRLLFKHDIADNHGSTCMNYYLNGQLWFSPDNNLSSDPSYLFEKLSLLIGEASTIKGYILRGIKSDKPAFQQFLKNHLPAVKNIFSEMLQTQSDNITTLVELCYSEDIGMSDHDLTSVLVHRLKSVINYMERFLSDKESRVRSDIEKLAVSKNQNAREASARLIKLWDSSKIERELDKITDSNALATYISTLFVKESEKKIPYFNELNLDNIRSSKNGEKVDPILMKYYISEYMLLKEPRFISSCEKIRAHINSSDVRNIMSSIYANWLKNNADTKLKNLLMPYAITCSDSDITLLKKQIDTWTENSRGALAAFAVTSLAMNGGNIALLLIDSISKKYKNKQVRAAATEALEQAAEALSITKEELGDRIIPDLGFSKNREKIFDYGTRKFKGLLTNKLDVLLYDESGKLIKSLPKPGAKDDAELAEQTSSSFKDLKKQLKTVVSNQKLRLEEAVISGRTWTREKWEELFVNNPIMNGFAIGLVWMECTANGDILGTFRYMEDGSFNTAEEEEHTFKENTVISLLHPLDVSEELLDTWKTQLSDYEIEQPITQLLMPVYQLHSSEQTALSIERFSGKKVYFGTIRSIMDKYDWKRTSIIDGGGYDGYYYENASSMIGIQIYFEYLYVGMEANESVTVEAISFYKKGTISYEGYTYDEINEKNRVLPKEVPAKQISFALMVGDLIVQKEISE